jgi:aromatic ring-cleaving dioxygenase
MVNRNHVTYTTLKPDLGGEIGMARSNKYEIDFCSTAFHQLLKLLATNKLTISIFRLEEKKITFILVCIMVFSNRFIVILNAMP